MITLHHLNKSRSKRIIWLLEELGVDYQVVAYQRDSVTFLAPPELKAVHPLGKSPVIEADGKVIAESGAITEYLIAKHAPLQLAPAPESAEYVEYLQWLHFAESSGILPLLLKVFLTKDGAQTQFLAQYADAEINKMVGYLDQSLQGKNYLVGETLSGADIMNSFIVEIVQQFGLLEQYPNLARYADTLASHPSFVKAQALEQQYN
ncbi:glutathione S-transferase family protein [Vibrio vulnificus]|uniref:glutathione S-transferase family protein n=1 Tax=Vibrio vulnificus TaxID=672 RepID=UPI00102386BC|nr:glutathione S-transferase [Vibrio vulnificus]RZP68988.1 glutathione S-transferase [Vibrio vulnificus]RZR17113.1 glutathione S-transferase [Vibrio vulnificus]HDY7775096.1 glutathione S-transferase [Vibrio vulnificus]